MVSIPNVNCIQHCTTSVHQVASVVMVLSGVCLVMFGNKAISFSDSAGATPVGALVAATAVCSSVLEQLGCRWLQKERCVSPLELSERSSLPMALILGLGG